MNDLILLAPELRRPSESALIVTSTGIVIGGAWSRPMPALTPDAERLQGALLAKPKEDRSYRFATWAMYVAAVLAVIVIVGVAK